MEANVKGEIIEIRKFHRTDTDIVEKLVIFYIQKPYRATVVKQRNGRNAVVIEYDYETGVS